MTFIFFNMGDEVGEIYFDVLLIISVSRFAH